MAASAGAATAEPTGNDKPYKLVIDKAAADAAEKAGFDLDRLTTRTAEKVFALLPHRDQIKINVRLDPQRTVPEIGVGAIPDPGTGDVYVVLNDKSKIGFRRSLATWVPASLARVLFLSSRIRTGPGYGITLGEALVSEGLSDHFVSQAFPKTPPQPWDHRRMTARQEAGLWRRAQRDLIVPGAYDHPLWFFGAGGKTHSTLVRLHARLQSRQPVPLSGSVAIPISRNRRRNRLHALREGPQDNGLTPPRPH